MKVAVVFIWTTIFLISLVSAQENKQPATVVVPAEQQKTAPSIDADAQQVKKSFEQIIPQRQFLEQALEQPVDSTTYLLGPGDQLLIKMWGAFENQFLVEVSPEGFILIPTVSQIDVAGKTLADAIGLIRTTLKTKFKTDQFSIRLVKLRKFRVFIVGEVEKPGTYFMRASDRLNDLIELAGGLTDWSNDTEIELRHGDSGRKVNFSNFLISGNLDNNPHLNSGDIVYIPPIDLSRNYAIIEGNVGSQGIYQIQPGETLMNFLYRVKAMNRKSNVENIVIIRHNQRRTVNLLQEAAGQKQEIVQSGDRILLPSNRNKVYVKGEVAQPGPLFFMANYRARDYAGSAGILETAKGLNSIYVIRMKTGKIEKGPDVIVQKGDIVVVPRKNREIFKDYMTIVTPILSMVLSTAAIIISVKK